MPEHISHGKRERSSWPADGGLMGELIREYNWHLTPLGPIELWPHSLRTAVELTLASPVATIVLWAPERIQIYNDLWIGLCPSKHPAALGQRTHECFPELINVLEPVYQQVWQGDGRVLEDNLLPVLRDGKLENAWWNNAYTPIRGESGAVEGIFCTVVETTAKVLAERANKDGEASLRKSEEQKAYLVKLGDALRLLADPGDVQATACGILGEHLAANRVNYAEVVREEYVVSNEYCAPGIESMAARYPTASFQLAERSAFEAGHTLSIPDVMTTPGLTPSEASVYEALGVRALVSVPILKKGRLVAVLSVVRQHPHEWQTNEVMLVQETAERTWSAVVRARAEEALRRNEEQLRTVLDHLAEGVVVMDPNGVLLHWNRKALQMLGYDRLEQAPVLYSTDGLFYEVRELDHTSLPAEQWPIPRLLRGEEMGDCELIVRRQADGRERIFNFAGSLVRDNAGQPILAVLNIRDITDFKKGQQALVRSEKLASVGRMAATIAHEINNPLASVMNALYLVSGTPDLPDSARVNLKIADQELRRIAHIARQTLGFYREHGAPTEVSLPEIVDGTLDLYVAKLKNKSIHVERRYRGAGRVFGIEGELRQIVSNLIANSIDAVGNKGGLYVRTVARNVKNRPMVQLTIADTGDGISPEDVSQIFEPFFSTKEAFGTGLGLWVTKELVRKHEGFIRVRSRVSKGTAFAIWFPAEGSWEDRDMEKNPFTSV